MKFSKSDLFTGAAILLLLKLICLGFTPADAAGSFFLMAGFLGDRVISFLFPKRPDLFKEVLDLQNQLTRVNQQCSDMERDLTALKMGAMRR